MLGKMNTIIYPILRRSSTIKPKVFSRTSLCLSSCLLTTSSKSKIDFGFKEVDYEEKKIKVGEVFSAVASKYDLMNDVMSGGLHRLWKDDFVNNIGLKAAAAVGSPPPKILDVAGGTGDISFRIMEEIQKHWSLQPSTGETDSESIITLFDINKEMMQVGQERAAARFDGNIASRIQWVQGNAEQLPFEENTFDVYTIAFGLRNVTNKENALSEAFRVLKPGGRFMCLEFSNVNLPIARQVYDAYSFSIIPLMGQMVAGDRDSYQYLVESIRVFPSKEELKTTMESVGFVCVQHLSYTLGAVALHSGIKDLNSQKSTKQTHALNHPVAPEKLDSV